MDLFDPLSHRLRQAVPLVALLAPSSTSAMPDTFRARLETLASMETLNAEILASRSATHTLEVWCEVHGMAANPQIKADVIHGVEKPPSDAQRQRLAAGPDDHVKYRHVRLMCGSHVLSEADNWYVPARLTPEMNRLLETTDTPFGKAIASMKPTRETFAVDVPWRPLPAGWQIHPPPADHPEATLDVPPILFEHRAILFDANHRPFSEVDEHYTRAILDFGTE